MNMICKKCNTKFDDRLSSCGTGITWDLRKCPECGQLYAQAYPKGHIPIEVQTDPEIIVIKGEKTT